MDIKTASILDVKDISYIHASSWKTAYKGIVPQEYLDNLKNDFGFRLLKSGYPIIQ